MEACYSERSKGPDNAVSQIPIRKFPHQIHSRAFRIVTCTPSGLIAIIVTTNERQAKYGRRTATLAEWSRARRTSGQGAALRRLLDCAGAVRCASRHYRFYRRRLIGPA